MTNLQNLQQQIVSEAVKAFREKFGMKVIETVNAGNYTSHFTADNPAIEEWLTDQLAQAMRKHGRAIVERLEAAKKQHPMQNYEFQEGFSSAIAHADSWLNHKSEGVPEELKTYTRPNTIDRNDLAP